MDGRVNRNRELKPLRAIRQLFLDRRIVAWLHGEGGGTIGEVAELGRVAEELGQECPLKHGVGKCPVRADA